MEINKYKSCRKLLLDYQNKISLLRHGLQKTCTVADKRMSHTVLYPAEIFDLGICDMFGLIPKSGFSYKIH